MAGSSYNPRHHGAKCDVCPLKGQLVVPPEPPETLRALSTAFLQPVVAVVGEVPGDQDERQQRPFVGPAGSELDKALRVAQLKRSSCHMTHVLLCRPPEGKLTEFQQVLSRQRKAMEKDWKKACEDAVKNNLPQPPKPDYPEDPVECCKPRFDKEISQYGHFITMGKTANQAVTGVSASILAVRGGLTELQATERTPARKVMPTVHPSFCLHQPRWFHVFRNDIHKAGRWFRGEADWDPPKITYHPTPQVLREFLSQDIIFTFDLETDGIESLTARIRCVGVGDENHVMLVGIRGKDGFSRFYDDPAEEREVIDILKQFFEDETKVKAGHNAGYYDKIVLQQQWGVTVRPLIDTILLHKSVESELPHGLAYVGSMYTDAPSWKTDRDGNKLSSEAENDQQLHEYCGFDVGITARVLPKLVEQVKLRSQDDVWRMDQKIQSVCADMHTAGMMVDQVARLAKEKELLSRRHALLSEIRDQLGNDEFNPGSVYHVRDLLFGKWKLIAPLEDEERMTSSGDPSTSDLVLRALLCEMSVPQEQRAIIKLMRYYRKVQKVLGTYVVKLRPWDMEAELGWDEDDDWVDKETRSKYGEVKRGIVNPRTGRMHPGYNAQVAVTGRLSSSKPINAQNFPKALRSMVVAAPGHVLVGADMDQLELRIAAARWGVELYLRAFEEGKDPHSMTAYAVFGKVFCDAAGVDPALFDRKGILVGKSFDERGKFIGDGESKKMRDLSKAVQYACLKADSRVVVLGEEPSKPIKGLLEGQDWTWCWSTQRKRYEPALITAVVHRGEKECVKVSICWGQGGKYRSEMVVTRDHLCLLRDGTFRPAGALQPGDRLMPFNRQIHDTGYRYVFPFNDERKIGEHRAVAGFYEVGEGEIHVHHKDEVRTNNVPSNLEEMRYDLHYEEHKEDIAEGRRNSQEWYNAVSNPETRSKASLKAWENRRENVANGGQDRTFGIRSSLLDAFSDKVGVLTDEEVAALASCTQEAVGYYRKIRNIPPPPGQRGFLKWLLTENPDWREMLFTLADSEIAKKVAEVYPGSDFTRHAVHNIRKEMGIPAPDKARVDKGKARKSTLDTWADRIGHESDRVVAAEANCTPEAVAYYRKSRGIPAYWKECPNGTNHEVVSVVPVGVHEVWDIEVDHEDHNFALECGVFVHNSQYMATVETVHKLIAKTEVPSKGADGTAKNDGTTDLPYAQLALRKVRQMRDNWLKGAPEFERGWEREIQTYRDNGFIAEEITGRRRDFLDGEAPNEIVNFPIQASAAGLMNLAIVQLHEQIPLHKWGTGTGIINQCHDSIVIECPESEGENVARMLEEAMNQVHPALPGVVFSAGADIGKDWKKVG